MSMAAIENANQYLPELVVVCQRTTGHRLSYARLLLAEAARDGFNCRLVMPSGGAGGEDYETHIDPAAMPHSVDTHDDYSPSGVQKLIDNYNRALIVFPDGDDLVPMLAFLRLRTRRNVLSVLVMRPSGQASATVKRRAVSLAKAVLRTIARARPRVSIFTLTSASQRAVGAWEVKDPIEFRPDPSAVTRLRAEWEGAFPRVTTWLGIVGAITPRKNVSLVLDAVGISGHEVGLVVAGSESDMGNELSEVALRAKRHAIPYVRIEGRLSDVALDSTVAAIDVAVLAHSNEGPSGILGKAAAAGRVIMAAGAQSLRRELSENPRLGMWSTLDAPSMATTISRLRGWESPSESVSSPTEFARKLLYGTEVTHGIVDPGGNE